MKSSTFITKEKCCNFNANMVEYTGLICDEARGCRESG